MKRTVMATYERESTLWKNANGRYHAQNWCKMVCFVNDYTEELRSAKEIGVRFITPDGKDVTEQELDKRYGRPYCVELINQRETNERCFWFKTKQEANEFFKQMLNHKIFNGWHRVK